MKITERPPCSFNVLVQQEHEGTSPNNPSTCVDLFGYVGALFPRCRQMNRLALSLALALLPHEVIASEGCTLGAILGSVALSDIARQDKAPEIRRPKGRLEVVSLFCPLKSLASDAFGYTAFINLEEGIAWIHQYGGYAGVSDWYGPVQISAAVATRCIKQPKTSCPGVMAVAE